MKEMALVAALAAIASLASALAEAAQSTGPKIQIKCSKEGKVDCTDGVTKGNGPCKGAVEGGNGESDISLKITEKGTTLTLICTDPYTAQPPAQPSGNVQVFTTNDCNHAEPLETSCSGATGKNEKNKAELSFPKLPCNLENFYLKCDQASRQKTEKPCKVHVTLPPKGQTGESGSSSAGGSHQPTSPVQTCEQKMGPITVNVPEKESVAQFACGNGLTLYPTEQGKVFSKDCKTKETLQDMTLTQTAGAKLPSDGATATTYTLKANKKPAKKTLCYVCAKTDPTSQLPKTAQDSCIIYVESGAGTQFGLSFIVALALPCVLAVFQFT